MFDTASLIWLIVGGILEPIWLIALKRSENFKNIGYTLLTIVAMIASPYCLSLAMVGIPMGISYAIWTGIGAVGAVGTGFLLFREAIDRYTLVCIAMIVAGVVGLAYMGGE